MSCGAAPSAVLNEIVRGGEMVPWYGAPREKQQQARDTITGLVAFQ